MTASDREWMALALREARRGRGTTSPNPMVGAVVVQGGRLAAKGYHVRAGGPHAEVSALAKAGGLARGADLYVTLEPCNHQGRTGPCTRAVIEAGIRRVVIAQLDSNPIAGGGVQVLQNAGIEVVTGVLEPQARDLNEVFNKYITTGRPFVILKSAATLDGKTASHTGHSRWVTGEKARQYVHRLRNQVDAILVGRGTVLADDPTLNTRLAGKKSVRHPLRVVLDTGLTLPLSARVFQPDLGGRTIVVSGPDPDPERMTRLEGLSVAVWPIPLHQGRIDLSLLMDRLGREQVTSVLIEGGAEVAASALLIRRIVDKILYFFAPKIIGGRLAPPLVGDPGLETMDQALNLDIQKVRRLGMDWLFEAVPRPAV